MVWRNISLEASSQSNDIERVVVRREFSKLRRSPETSSENEDVGDRASDIQHGVEEHFA